MAKKSGVTPQRGRVVRGVILAWLLNEDQLLARSISLSARRIVNESYGMVTEDEIRETLDPWVKRRVKR